MRNTGGQAIITGYKRRDVIKERLEIKQGDAKCMETHWNALRWPNNKKKNVIEMKMDPYLIVKTQRASLQEAAVWSRGRSIPAAASWQPRSDNTCNWAARKFGAGEELVSTKMFNEKQSISPQNGIRSMQIEIWQLARTQRDRDKDKETLRTV